MSELMMESAASLRTVYLTRFGVQLGWAAGVVTLAESSPAVAGALITIYPVWDVACTLYEIRRTAPPHRLQVANVVLGLATAVAIGSTVFVREPWAVAAFGGWALAAGALQLLVGVARRRQVGGQVAMVLSGAQSTLAGAFFISGGLAMKIHVKDIAGYAVFGAVYFLVAGLLLWRRQWAAQRISRGTAIE